MRNLSGTADKSVIRLKQEIVWGVFYLPQKHQGDQLLPCRKERHNMSYQLKEVADRIRTLREIAGYSQEEMAEKAEVSFEEYVKLEEAERRGFTPCGKNSCY